MLLRLLRLLLLLVVPGEKFFHFFEKTFFLVHKFDEKLFISQGH
jgi:hypothetical protein